MSNTYFSSCNISLALNMVIREVLADGIIMIGVRDTLLGGPDEGRG